MPSSDETVQAINDMMAAQQLKRDVNKPQPDIDKINTIMQQMEDTFERMQPNQAELALVGLTVLHAMLNDCQARKTQCPSSMAIQTPSGHEISYTIRKQMRNQPAPLPVLNSSGLIT